MSSSMSELKSRKKPDGAATESSSNRGRIVRNFSCQEFWNLEQEYWRFEIRDGTFERGDGTMGH